MCPLFEARPSLLPDNPGSRPPCWLLSVVCALINLICVSFVSREEDYSASLVFNDRFSDRCASNGVTVCQGSLCCVHGCVFVCEHENCYRRSFSSFICRESCNFVVHSLIFKTFCFKDAQGKQLYFELSSEQQDVPKYSNWDTLFCNNKILISKPHLNSTNCLGFKKFAQLTLTNCNNVRDKVECRKCCC